MRLSPPPRAIPLTLRLRLLSNLGVMVGAAVLGVGLVIASFTYPLKAVRGQWALARGGQEIAGVVERVEFTNTRINEQPVYRFEYKFTLGDFGTHTGKSYSRSRRTNVPQAVTIEYLPDDPNISRMRGMSMTIAPIWVPLMFVGPGVVVMIFAIQHARQQIRPLREGELAVAKIETCRVVTTDGYLPAVSLEEFHKRPEGERPRVRRVRCAFEYTDHNGVVRHGRNDFAYDESRPMSAEGEAVIYGPGNRRSPVLLRALPLETIVLSSGELEAVGQPAGPVLRFMLLLALIIAPLAWYLNT